MDVGARVVLHDVTSVVKPVCRMRVQNESAECRTPKHGIKERDDKGGKRVREKRRPKRRTSDRSVCSHWLVESSRVESSRVKVKSSQAEWRRLPWVMSERKTRLDTWQSAQLVRV